LRGFRKKEAGVTGFPYSKRNNGNQKKEDKTRGKGKGKRKENLRKIWKKRKACLTTSGGKKTEYQKKKEGKRRKGEIAYTQKGITKKGNKRSFLGKVRKGAEGKTRGIEGVLGGENSLPKGVWGTGQGEQPEKNSRKAYQLPTGESRRIGSTKKGQ